MERCALVSVYACTWQWIRIQPVTAAFKCAPACITMSCSFIGVAGDAGNHLGVLAWDNAVAGGAFYKRLHGCAPPQVTIFAFAAWAGAGNGGVIAGLGVCGFVMASTSSAATLMQVQQLPNPLRASVCKWLPHVICISQQNVK